MRANVAVGGPSALVRQAVTIRLARPGAPDHVEGAQAPGPAMSDAPSERSGIEESPGPLASTGVIAIDVRTVQPPKWVRVTIRQSDDTQST
jgi:hypothetical protein